MTETAKKEEYVERAGTVELDASVGNHQMFAYMVPGCCGLRSFYGFDGKQRYENGKSLIDTPTPEEVIEGIVTSGISGSLMVLTDVYNKGEQAERFKKFVEENNLGTVTIAPPVRNVHTGSPIVGVLFGYSPSNLMNWLYKYKEEKGEPTWSRPNNWWSSTAAVHMDSVFYQGGGRPKPKSNVQLPDWLKGASNKGEEK